MVCKKCGCDALIKKEDWYICPQCGAQIFDSGTDEPSPTHEVEQAENDITQTEKEDSTAVEPAPKAEKENNKQDSKEEEEKSPLKDTIDFLAPIVIAVVIAILLKTFVFANAVVPTGSMLDTIQFKDRVIASRLAYINDDPERGDILIFINPDYDEDLPQGNGNEKYYVKRVIGLPGETVEIVNGVTYITDSEGKQYQLDESSYLREEQIGDFGPYEVPEGCYFMMGDNRNASLDARYWQNKFVTKDNIIGKVKFRYYRAKEYRQSTFDFFAPVS